MCVIILSSEEKCLKFNLLSPKTKILFPHFHLPSFLLFYLTITYLTTWRLKTINVKIISTQMLLFACGKTFQYDHVNKTHCAMGIFNLFLYLVACSKSGFTIFVG